MGQCAAVKTTGTTSAEPITPAAVLRNEAALTGAHDIQIRDGIAYIASDADSPIAPRRYNLIHAYFPNPEDAARAARLGVVVDTQPCPVKKLK